MQSHSAVPAVCIVGRPNVGKSSIFNQILGERKAVVFEQSGTTRDRLETVMTLGNISIKLVDTGGYVSGDKDTMSLAIKDQIYSAMEEASVILLVVDTQSGITPADREVAALLRTFDKPVLLVANKADNEDLAAEAVEFFQLGFGDPEIVSCAQRSGFRSLKAAIKGFFKDRKSLEGEAEKHFVKVAIVGRPNVGKSSLINNVLKTNRVIVSNVPGTTRDSIDTYFSMEGRHYILIDTAGMRHRRKIKTPVDTFSIMRSKESIVRSDVVVLMLDSIEGICADDMGILRFVEEKGKACLIVVNKWDLSKKIEGVTREEYEKQLGTASNELTKYPICFVSAKTGEKVSDIFGIVDVLDANLDTKASTPFLNRLFENRDPSMLPIPRSSTRPNFMYITQAGSRPMQFVFFVSNPALVLTNHKSFIENQLRNNLPLKGIPVRLKFKASKSGKERKEKEEK